MAKQRLFQQKGPRWEPTPEEIRAGCKAIQQTWSRREKWRRRWIGTPDRWHQSEEPPQHILLDANGDPILPVEIAVVSMRDMFDQA